MKFTLSTSASCFIIGSVLVNAVAIPVPQNDCLQACDSSVSSFPVADAYLTLSKEEETSPVLNQRTLKARKSKKKPKTPAKKPTDKPKTPTEKPKAPTKPQKPPKETQTPHQPQWKGPVPSEAEITKKCNVPKDKALFWSGTSKQVHTYNAKAGLVTDSQAFPDNYTWRFRGKDPAKSALFAERFSRVFAREASGEVHLMVPWKTGPRPDRVFHKDEWPILKKSLKSGKVTKITQVNPDNFQETRVYDPTAYGLTKRTEIDLDNVPWDVNLDALAEAWERNN
ncbi:hypothetical protein DM02DRAFT_677164 [Periconia macrospinosa]|uniref:ADP-ribosylation n=1 Tax=Periconia macrospinosa TaxID=97972 RepID=A0A2V1D4L9_9PLEO|nr:hypothetical protein DM02DRAFT_677164 [Periconia macrospinosa]